MATLSGRRRWRTTRAENAADAHAQTFWGGRDSDPARGSGTATFQPSPDWLGPDLAGARRIRLLAARCVPPPRPLCRWPARVALPDLGRIDAELPEIVGLMRRRPGASPSALPAFGTRGGHEPQLGRGRARPNCPRSETQVADLLWTVLVPTRPWHRRNGPPRRAAPSQVAGS
jgi:hypothetical protein